MCLVYGSGFIIGFLGFESTGFRETVYRVFSCVFDGVEEGFGRSSFFWFNLDELFRERFFGESGYFDVIL